MGGFYFFFFFLRFKNLHMICIRMKKKERKKMRAVPGIERKKGGGRCDG